MIVIKLVDLTYDAPFKEFFKDVELLESFINAVTGKNLKIISTVPTEEKSLTDGRSIIFDILAKDETGKKINIEMEKHASQVMKKRTQFYWAKAFTRGFEKRQGFNLLQDTICINVLGENIFKDEDAFREFVVYDKEHEERLDNSLSIYFIELKKAKGLSDDNIKNLWAKLLSSSEKAIDLLNKDYIINKAIERVEDISEVDEIQLQIIKEAKEESERADLLYDSINQIKVESALRAYKKVKNVDEVVEMLELNEEQRELFIKNIE